MTPIFFSRDRLNRLKNVFLTSSNCLLPFKKSPVCLPPPDASKIDFWSLEVRYHCNLVQAAFKSMMGWKVVNFNAFFNSVYHFGVPQSQPDQGRGHQVAGEVTLTGLGEVVRGKENLLFQNWCSKNFEVWSDFAKLFFYFSTYLSLTEMHFMHLSLQVENTDFLPPRAGPAATSSSPSSAPCPTRTSATRVPPSALGRARSHRGWGQGSRAGGGGDSPSSLSRTWSSRFDCFSAFLGWFSTPTWLQKNYSSKRVASGGGLLLNAFSTMRC